MLPAPILHINLLGSLEIGRGDSNPPILLRRTTAAALAYLAASDQPHSRQEITETFCQEADDPPAALRSVLSRIRRRLGSDVLLADGNTIQFNQAAAQVDCRVFARTLDNHLA